VTVAAHGWAPERPRFRIGRLLTTWLAGAVALSVAAVIVPGASVTDFTGAVAASAVIALLNAVLPPVVAALRLPFTLLVGFFLVLLLDALMLLAADRITGGLHIDSIWSALGVAFVASAVSATLGALLAIDDDDVYSLRVVQRVARRVGGGETGTAPGILFLEIDGLALPVLQRAMRDGHAPTMARWVESGTHGLFEWETDLSSQTGASQAGILLGSNDDIPAFRWVEKETGTLVQCSSPPQCAELEQRRSTGTGLLAHGGASRGNLFSGDADHMILTVSRMDEERRSNPGYRSFLANGFNVTRTLALFAGEVCLEWIAATQSRRRDVRPRGARGGLYPFMRAALCVFVRDLIVFGVLSDMMNGRPAIYATFSSYDEVAHHSGLERNDTLEALRRLDRQFARIEAALPYAARPYELVVLSDHGQTQGATFKQRNGYGLDELVRQNLAGRAVAALVAGDEQDSLLGHAADEATGKRSDAAPMHIDDDRVVVLGSGNLGLVYLMEEQHRLSLEEIDERHPKLIEALLGHQHVGWLLVHTREHGAVVLGQHGTRYLETETCVGDDPLSGFAPTAARHLLRADGFPHAADITLGSFYDAALEEGCAFEELISFHGGLGGPQTRPFVLHPVSLPAPTEPVLGAEALHRVLADWRASLGDERVLDVHPIGTMPVTARPGSLAT
jgi:uncharacterized membrane protein YvlD (DUF360 family)